MSEKQKHSPNRKSRAGRKATLTLLTTMLLAACGDDGPKVTFEDYSQAGNRLEQLARQHGDTDDVPEAVSSEIKQSLQAGIPFLKEHVGDQVSGIVKKLSEKAGYDDMGSLEMPDGRTYRYYSAVTDDGEHIESVDISRRVDYSDGLHTITSQELWITRDEDGQVTSFRYANGSNTPTDFSWDSELVVAGDDITISHVTDTDPGNPREGGSGRYVDFNGQNFGRYAADGPMLAQVMESIQEANDFLTKTSAELGV